MQLKPCPFCGGTKVVISFYAARCACGATGPFALTDAEAARQWNQRSEPFLVDQTKTAKIFEPRRREER